MCVMMHPANFIRENPWLVSINNLMKTGKLFRDGSKAVVNRNMLKCELQLLVNIAGWVVKMKKVFSTTI